MSETSLEHKSTSLNKLNYAIFVCSTSRYNQKKKKIKDVSGDNIKNTLIKSGNNVILKKIIPDDKNRIIDALKEALESSNIHAIIFSGGIYLTWKVMLYHAGVHTRSVIAKSIAVDFFIE